MESIRTLDKSAILATLVRRMEQRTGAMRARTADTAYQASLQEDRMKTRYDTMRIEGSWLADGMNRVAGEMAAQLTRAKHYEFRAPAGELREGSLVHLSCPPDRFYCFVLPFFGGTMLTVEGKEILVVNPAAPLLAQALGRHEGGEFEFRGRRYRVEEIA